MTKKEVAKEESRMLDELGWSNPSIEYAGSGCKFKSTQTAYKFRYTNENGQKCFRGLDCDSLYYFLKFQFRTEECTHCDKGIVLRSNYGSCVRTTCHHCGGYYLPNPKLKSK